jgi:hypothetical protein
MTERQGLKGHGHTAQGLMPVAQKPRFFWERLVYNSDSLSDNASEQQNVVSAGSMALLL